MKVRGMEAGAKAQRSTHGWISFQPVKSHRKDLKVTMKIKQLFKKAAAMVMAAVTVLSLLPATAFAATGDVGTISFTRTYDSAGNAMYYNSSAVINGYTAGGTGKNKYRMYVDGSTAFCMRNSTVQARSKAEPEQDKREPAQNSARQTCRKSRPVKRRRIVSAVALRIPPASP